MRFHPALFLCPLILIGCSRGQVEGPVDATVVRIGYSGLARLDSKTFLVVHDTKKGQSGPRLGVVKVGEQGNPRYQSLRWNAPVLPSDLESACSIPDRPGEFLIVESGYRKGKGMIFHIKVAHEENGPTVQLLGMLRLPAFVEDIEGAACVKTKDGQLLLILGERGGVKGNSSGQLRWGPITLNGETDTLAWPEAQKTQLKPLPGHGKGWRACTDLHIDGKGQLWLTTGYDPGRSGPFRSTIVRVGRVDPDAPEGPIRLDEIPEVTAEVDGIKIEGLAGPYVAGSTFTIATDDEDRGGTFRSVALIK